MGEKETDQGGSDYKESFEFFFFSIIIIHVRFLANVGITRVCRKSLLITKGW
jgi:hypothetical protein